MATPEKPVEKQEEQPQQGSFWSTLTATCSTIGSQVQKAVSTTYQDLSGKPSKVMCCSPTCRAELQIPEAAWQWTCSNCTFKNEFQNKACGGCDNVLQVPFQPVIRCGYCSTITYLSTTKLGQTFSDIGKKTVHGANDIATSTSNTYSHLKSTPQESFHCGFCGGEVKFVELWSCSSCTFQNKAALTKCEMCNADRPAVSGTTPCPTCKKDTPIPSTNLTSSINKGWTQASNAATKAYYDLSGKKYFQCQTCWQCNLIDTQTTDLVCPRCQTNYVAPENAQQAQTATPENQTATPEKQ